MKFGYLFFIFFVEVGLAVGKLRANVQRIYVTEGGSFELTCKAEPKLIRSYRWVYVRERKANDNSKRDPLVLSSGRRLMIGETRFSVTTEPRDGYIAITLTFDDIRRNESGYFMCWRQGLKPDPRVYVRVLAKGAATAQPSSMEVTGPPQVKYGSPVTINCLIRPYLPGNVTWFRNSQVISSTDRAHSQSLEEKDKEFVSSLKVSTARGNANYTCMVPSNPPLEKTYQMIVTVGKVEELTMTPDKDSIQYGMNLRLTCTASGTDSEIVWLKDGSMLSLDDTKGHFLKVSTQISDGKWRSILDVSSFSMADNGHYVCYVPGDSQNILVNIEGRSPRMLGVTGSNFMENDVVHLTCTTQYDKGREEVSWFFNNEPLSSEWWIEKNNREAKHNTTHHDLSIPSASSEHAGTYTCTTSFGSSMTTIRQIVPPYLVEGPSESQTIAVEGELFSITCSVAGFPAPEVVWEKWIDNKWKIVEEAKTEGEEEVQGIEINSIVLEENAEVIGERRELLFKVVEPFHGGKYQCVGYADKELISVSTEIIVIDPKPEIVKVFADEVMEGENLTISCSITNWDSPVDFTSGLKVLSPELDSRYSFEFQGYGHSFLGGQVLEEEATRNEISTYALVISGAKLEDQGVYRCQAGTELSKSITVKVKQRPPEIIEVAASPAVEKREFFVSCTVKNIPNDEQVSFYFDKKQVGASHDDKRHTVYLAEKMEDPAFVEGGRAKQATYVLKISRANIEDTGRYQCSIRPEINAYIDVVVAPLETVDEIVTLKAFPAWIEGILLLKCVVENWEGEVTFLQNTSLPIEEDDSRFQITRESFGNSTVHSLRITDISPEDSGYYQCYTTPFTFADVNITLREKESLTIQFEKSPSDTPVKVASLISLRCSVNGISEELNYTLQITHEGTIYSRYSSAEEEEELKSGKKDPSAANIGLVLEKVEYEHGGLWQCRITFDETGYSREQSVNIEVYDPLEFVDIPEPFIEKKPGSELILRCAVVGYPIASVYWIKEGTDGGHIEEGEESADVVIPTFLSEDAGVYVCYATNIYQNITYATQLEIIHELEIIDSPDPILFVGEHETIDLNCTAYGSEPPQVEWSRDSQQEILSEPLASGSEVSILHISNFTEEDAATYTCRAYINGVEKIATTELILARKEVQTSLPTTTPRPTLVSGRLLHLIAPSFIEENDQLTLICLVSPLLDAYRALIVVNNSMIAIDEQIMTKEPRVNLEVGKGGAGERLLKVQIDSITKADSGLYECRANTKIITRHSIRIEVVGEGELTTAIFNATEETSISGERIHLSNQTPLPQSSTVAPYSTTVAFWSTPTASSGGIATTTDSPDYSPTYESSSALSTDQDEYPDQVFGNPYYDNGQEYEELDVTIEEDEHVYMDVMNGDSVLLTCTIHSEATERIPIIWKRVKSNIILFVDYVKVTTNDKFSLEIFDGNNTYIRNLKISNLTHEEQDAYICLTQSKPLLNTTVHLKVHEREETISSTESSSTEAVSFGQSEVDTFTSNDTQESGAPSLEYEQVEDEFVLQQKQESDQEDGDIEQDYRVGEEEDFGTEEVNGEQKRERDDSELDRIEEEQDGEKEDMDESSYSDSSESLYDATEEADENAVGGKVKEEQQEEEKEWVKEKESEEEKESEDKKEPEKVKEPEELEITQEGSNLDDQEESKQETSTEPEPEVETGDQFEDQNTKVGLHFSSPQELEDDLTTRTLQNQTRLTTETSSTVRPYDIPKMGILSVSSTVIPRTTDFVEMSTDLVTTEASTQAVKTTLSARKETTSPSSTEESRSTTSYSTEAATIATPRSKPPEEQDRKPYTQKTYNEKDHTSPSPPKPEKHSVIIALPGEDVLAPSEAEVHLNCPTSAVPEDITWKGDEKLLFLGSLDLAGVEGIHLDEEGNLNLLSGYSDIKNGIAYACLVYDYDTHEDVQLVTYHVYLDGEAATIKKEDTTEATISMTVSEEALEFFGLEFESIAVLSNNKLAGNSLTQVLQQGGMDVNLIEKVCNGNSSLIEGWKASRNSIKECEMKARNSGSLKDGQSVFIILDFIVSLPTNNLYGSTLIYVHNVARDIKAHVFGPLVPLPSSRDIPQIECGSPVYEDQDLGLDLEGICRSAVSSSILTLQETYLSQAKKLPLF